MNQDSRGRVNLKAQINDSDWSLYVEFYDVTEGERRQVIQALDTLYRSMGGSGLKQVSHESSEEWPNDMDVPGIPVEHFVALIEQHLARTKEGRS